MIVQDGLNCFYLFIVTFFLHDASLVRILELYGVQIICVMSHGLCTKSTHPGNILKTQCGAEAELSSS